MTTQFLPKALSTCLTGYERIPFITILRGLLLIMKPNCFGKMIYKAEKWDPERFYGSTFSSALFSQLSSSAFEIKAESKWLRKELNKWQYAQHEVVYVDKVYPSNVINLSWLLRCENYIEIFAKTKESYKGLYTAGPFNSHSACWWHRFIINNCRLYIGFGSYFIIRRC